MFGIWCAVTIMAVALLLAAEYRKSRRGVWIAKPVAATGFVAAAVAAGALGSPYGRWVLAALVLSWFGDVFLIPKGSSRAFLAGLASFLLGHVAFVVAFAVRGIAPPTALVALLLVVGPLLIVLRWLRPHVEGAMRGAVYAYMGVISLMVVCAAGTVAAHGDPRILLGALMFFVSDLAVARQRFVVSTLWNPAWGLPLYFGAQLVLASTV